MSGIFGESRRQTLLAETLHPFPIDSIAVAGISIAYASLTMETTELANARLKWIPLIPRPGRVGGGCDGNRACVDEDCAR